MTCLPETDPGATAGERSGCCGSTCGRLSPRNPGVAAVRRKFDERWRQTIETTVLFGQEAGEFSATVDAARVRGHAVGPARRDGRQIALEDPDVPPRAGL